MATTVDREMRNLRNEFSNLRDDFRSVVGRLGNVTKAGAKSWMGDTGVQIGQKMESAEEVLAEHPITYVLVAFGAGILLGRLFASR
jgi:ElaB/YqjD/DUF883 family membrane-anchored ribosome-binding protein